MKPAKVKLTTALSVAWAVLASASAVHAKPDVAAAKANVERYRELPVFTPPGEPFDAAGCMAGKKIMAMPVSSANPFNKNIVQAMSEVAKTMGFEVTEWENQGRPVQWAEGIEHAANNGYDGAVLIGGVNPAVLSPQITEARKKGLSVFTAHMYDTLQTPDPSSTELNLNVKYHEAGELLVDWMVAKTDGKVNALIIGSDEVVPTSAFVKGITDKLDQCGDACGYTYVNVPIPDWSTKVQTSVQSALIADPTINYVVPIYDSAIQFVIPAITITGKKDQVKIVSFNGTPFVLDEMRKGNVEMDIGESIGWIARSILDGSMRKMCGLEAKDELYVPFYVFDESNVETAGTPASFDQGYGDSYIRGYSQLWGLE